MRSRSHLSIAVAVAIGVAVGGLLLPGAVSNAQSAPEVREGPATPVVVEAPVPLPVAISGGEVTIGEDSATLPVEIGTLPLPVAVTESSADRVTLRGVAATTCDDGCPRFVSTSVSAFDALPEGKHLLVETVTVEWEIRNGDPVRATAALNVIGGDFQRHLVGETVEVPGFTGGDAFATANLSFVADGSVTGVVGFPDGPPDGTSIGVNLFVAGRFIDAPSG